MQTHSIRSMAPGIILLGSIAIIYGISHQPPFLHTSAQTAESQPLKANGQQPTGPAVGDKRTITGGTQILAARYYHNAKDMRTAQYAGDHAMLQEMIDRSDLIIIASGTECTVLEIVPPFARIRLRNGTRQGFIGYIELYTIN